ncbi:PAS domain S-box/diguanylate cyclase (GGDEF) domain-containing protein [Acidovorax sp. CF316]|uniref:bifunctional diguanylate cyclase/phosphodiesterase n=1 Tax=Acidovorax sp. CF316 TaxID=1144317 RepID=UPI00026BE49D|nr:diguanylate cyclase [Acidovorax sp. CF316]EJE52833.1 PAS domain S-box/diguanylate cyclase (GGDEF) domain-containing protein [Acidovorax sp. CF316]
MHFSRQFFSHRLIWLALLVSLGIGLLFARTIWTMREDSWDYASRTNANLASTLERSLGGTLRSLDESLKGVVAGLERPEVMALPPEIRNGVLFDNSLQVPGSGSVLVVDERGDVVLDSSALKPRQANFADRDYFLAFSQGGQQGLHVGRPVPSRITGLYILPLTRAYYHQNGRFAGVVVGAIRLNYFDRLFGSLDLGVGSRVDLYRTDGLLVSRFPLAQGDVNTTIAGTAALARLQATAVGIDAVDAAAADGSHQLQAWEHVGSYPLIVNVAQSSDTVLAKWRRSAWVLSIFSALLMAGCVGLAMLFVRELLRRQAVSAELRAAERDRQTILDNLPSLVSYWDADLTNRFANSAYDAWFGVAPEQLRGMRFGELLGPDQYAMCEPFLRGALRGERQLFECTLIDRAGQLHHAIVSYVPDMDGDQVRGVFSQTIDITDRKRMEEQLFEEKERIRLTLQAIGDAVICADAQGHITYLNPVAERLTGWQAFDAAGSRVEAVVRLQEPDTDRILPSALHGAINGHPPEVPVRGVVQHRTSGQRFDVEETASTITDRHGTVTGAVAVLRDVTEAVAMQARMAHLAQYDALTDLPNRLLLQDRAQLAIAHARRDRRCLAVMYLDLDGFKAVNDRLGHDMGDRLLVQFAQRLKSAVRGSDTVCRQGGDEFVVLLPGLEDAEGACSVARKMLAGAASPFELGGEALRIGLSGGIAMFPEHGATFEELTQHADAAMYAAKRGGRLQFMLYAGPGAEPRVITPPQSGPG